MAANGIPIRRPFGEEGLGDLRGVKFLFNPGSTEFWSDARVSGQYGMWMRQIAKEGTGSRVCMDVVGHTSRTGSESVNDALSLRRAEAVRQKLGAESAALAWNRPLEFFAANL